MRPGLRLLLTIVLALTALSLLWPTDSAPVITAAVERVSTPMDAPAGPGGTVSYASFSGAPFAGPEALLVRLLKTPLEIATGDPFAGVKPPAPEPPKPLIGPVYVPPPPPPQAPALNYRYLGQMTSPSGERSVYLARADIDLRVSLGTQLDEGYVVQAISADAVHLYYPPLDVKAVIAIPPNQESVAVR